MALQSNLQCNFYGFGHGSGSSRLPGNELEIFRKRNDYKFPEGNCKDITATFHLCLLH